MVFVVDVVDIFQTYKIKLDSQQVLNKYLLNCWFETLHIYVNYFNLGTI